MTAKMACVNVIFNKLQNFETANFKAVICGKHKNKNKTTKKKTTKKKKTYLPESEKTSYFCCSLQFTMQNRGTCCLKKVF